MDSSLMELVALTVLFLFFVLLLVFTLIISKIVRKSEKYREDSRKKIFELYGINDIRERLDDIAEIRKSNAEILEKLNRLVEEKEGESQSG